MTNIPEEFDENENWLTDEDATADLNWKWREVVKSLMDGKYIGEAYAQVYGVNYTTEQGKRNAQSNGSRLMRNDRFRRLWRRVVAEIGLNSEAVDTELYKLIVGKDVDNSVRLKAIIAYNSLRGRIVRNVRLDGEVRRSPLEDMTLEELRVLAAVTKPDEQ